MKGLDRYRVLIALALWWAIDGKPPFGMALTLVMVFVIDARLYDLHQCMHNNCYEETRRAGPRKA